MTVSNNIHAWIVEDEEEMRTTMRYVLDNTRGINCKETFIDCEGSLKAITHFPPDQYPDVILLDINLPGINGIECIGKIKALLPDSKIVMLTIVDKPKVIFNALRAGASGYLLKNAKVDDIIAAVRAAAVGGTLLPPKVATEVLGFFTEFTLDIDYGLTKRENEVLHEMVKGNSQKMIAENLYISPYTVNSHIQKIYEKLHVHSNVEAVSKALRERLI